MDAERLQAGGGQSTHCVGIRTTGMYDFTFISPPPLQCLCPDLARLLLIPKNPTTVPPHADPRSLLAQFLTKTLILRLLTASVLLENSTTLVLHLF